MTSTEREALTLAREVIADDHEGFVGGNSSYGDDGELHLDLKSLNGYEIETLERYERALALINLALSEATP